MAVRSSTGRDWAVSPGEILAEALEERRMSQSELARRMDRPVKTINEIVNAKTALTPETALQLELVLGIPASLWVNLEADYRRFLAERKTLRAFAGYESWLRAFPIKDLARHGLIARQSPAERQVAQLLAFFGVGNPDAWEVRWGAPLVDYRASATFEGSDYARAAWLRWGEILAANVDTAPFDAQRLLRVAEQIRSFTRIAPVQAAIDEAQVGLSAVGVVLVVVPEFEGTRLSGAARWLNPETAIVQLSLRHKTDDHLWFSCMHEIGHLLDRPRHDFVDAVDARARDYDDPDAEARANRFARDLLIEPKAFREFIEAGSFDAASVRSFAENQRVAPGIVVGRLQHDRVIPPARLNGLKKPVRFG